MIDRQKATQFFLRLEEQEPVRAHKEGKQEKYVAFQSTRQYQLTNTQLLFSPPSVFKRMTKISVPNRKLLTASCALRFA